MPSEGPFDSALAVVGDVAASWATYVPRVPAPGLLLHVAGPTDEGFRTIDVWVSAAAYERHRSAHGDDVSAELAVPPVVRTLSVRAWMAPETGRATRCAAR